MKRLTCPTCKGWARERVTDCPLKSIPAETWELLEAADLAKQGSWPNGRGWLHETQFTIDAVRYIWNEQVAAKTEHEAE